MNFINKKYPEEKIREYIEKYLENLDFYFWDCISAFQNLSEEFLIEFIESIEIGDERHWGLIDNKKIPEDVKNRIKNLKKVIDQ